MKKLAISILVISFVALFLSQYPWEKTDENNLKAKVDKTTYLKNKGYEIIADKGKDESYVLEKDKLEGPHYGVMWGMQAIDIEDYYGKIIESYKFVVKNHCLDKIEGNSKHQTFVWLLVSDNKIIGGYSYPDFDEPHVGSFYSLEGKTLEEVTRKDFIPWTEEWKKKCEDISRRKDLTTEGEEDIKKIVWDQLSKQEQEEVVGGWQNAKIEKIVADKNRGYLSDLKYEGLAVYMVTYKSIYEPLLGDLQVYVDIKTKLIVGGTYRL